MMKCAHQPAASVSPVITPHCHTSMLRVFIGNTMLCMFFHHIQFALGYLLILTPLEVFQKALTMTGVVFVLLPTRIFFLFGMFSIRLMILQAASRGNNRGILQDWAKTH